MDLFLYLEKKTVVTKNGISDQECWKADVSFFPLPYDVKLRFLCWYIH